MKTYSLLLLSLSGVRVRDGELAALGMTLPGFIERGKTIAALPSLGLLTLAGQTPPHWHMEYREADEFQAESLADDLAGGNYDLIAISALTARVLEAYELSDALRRRGCTIVLGGLHVSVLPLEAAAHADAIVGAKGSRGGRNCCRILKAGIFSRLTAQTKGGPFTPLPMRRLPAMICLIPLCITASRFKPREAVRWTARFAGRRG